MIANLTIHLVGDFLYADRRERDIVLVQGMVDNCAQNHFLTDYAKVSETLLNSAAATGGRILLTDAYGKVQFDSSAKLNGTVFNNHETSSVLVLGQKAEYGIHQKDENLSEKENAKAGEWFSCCAVAVKDEQQTLGAMVYLSSVTDIILQLTQLQKRISYYFLAAAIAAIIAALIFSGILTRPITLLTKGIKRMSHGDFSVRVKESGSGEIRRLSEAFNTMSEKLETLDQSRNQFVSNASHELKTPLATMKILIENIIYQPDMDAEIRTEFLTDINKEINRLSLIVSDLLTLVSMDAKTAKLTRTTFALSEVVEEVRHRLQPIAEKRWQTLEVQINDPCDIYADRPKLYQVIYNLTENAIKYTPEGGKITMRLDKSGHDAQFSVQDNGPGIPKEDQAHIFDRFYRVDKARSRETGGTGLGLSIVHQLVLMHGGSVTVASEEGQGSLFTVELPIHQG